MARIRTVKPELFKHEDLFDLEEETGLPLRVSWIGLFTIADREGRFKLRPRAIKAEVLPYDEVDFSRVLHALQSRGFVDVYENAGEFYACIPSFSKHQVINNKEKASGLPGPKDQGSSIVNDVGHLLTREERVTDACPTPLFPDQGEGKGREGKRKGREQEGNTLPTGEAKVSDFIAAYCSRFKTRWNVNPQIRGKESGIIKRLAKDMSLDRYTYLLDAFFQMPDAWVVKVKHPIGVFDEKINEITVFADSGKFTTQTQARQADNMASTQMLLNKIREEGK